MKIFNFTQHAATTAQIEAGVIDLVGDDLHELLDILTFTSIPTSAEVQAKAKRLFKLAGKYDPSLEGHGFMIGGAPYLMAQIPQVDKVGCFNWLFAYSERVSVEQEVNGEVVKTSVFNHAGFVPLY